MRIGTMFFGEVDRLDHENIQTKFFVLGVPLFPLASFYVLGQEGTGVNGIELPSIHGKSALFGYVRVMSGLAALLLAVFAYIERRGAEGMWFGCVVAVVLWGVTTFAMGRLSDGEKERRRVLRGCVGLGAPPEILGAELRRSFAEKLEMQWTLLKLAEGNDTDAVARLAEQGAEALKSHPTPPWRPCLDRPEGIAAGHADVLYALARYHGEDEGAERIWRAHFAIGM